MINKSIIKSNEELKAIYRAEIDDSKSCFYKCEMRNIKLNLKGNDLNDFGICIRKCLELSDYKEGITKNFYKQTKEFVNNPNLYSLRVKINEITSKAREYERINNKYYFEDFRYSTSAEIKYEDMKKHEIGSLFGRNK